LLSLCLYLNKLALFFISLTHDTKGTLLLFKRQMLINSRFQDLFHPLIDSSTFHSSLTVLIRYRFSYVFLFEGGTPILILILVFRIPSFTFYIVYKTFTYMVSFYWIKNNIVYTLCVRSPLLTESLLFVIS